MKLRGWMFVLPLPLLAIALVMIVLSRWGGWVLTQICVSAFSTWVLLRDEHQAPESLAVSLALIWIVATANTALYFRHLGRRTRVPFQYSSPPLDLTPYRRR